MSDDKDKVHRDNPENTPKERPRQKDINSDVPAPKNSGIYIGESQKQQDDLRKAMEIPPRPPKPSKDNDD